MTREEALAKSAGLFASARNIITERKLSVSKFCELIGITRTSYYNFCNDDSGPTEFYQVMNLAAFVKDNAAPSEG